MAATSLVRMTTGSCALLSENYSGVRLSDAANMRLISDKLIEERERSMDEASFEIDADQLAAASRRFPAHRRNRRDARPRHDVSHLDPAPSADFAQHAWDEGGHI